MSLQASPLPHSRLLCICSPTRPSTSGPGPARSHRYVSLSLPLPTSNHQQVQRAVPTEPSQFCLSLPPPPSHWPPGFPFLVSVHSALAGPVSQKTVSHELTFPKGFRRLGGKIQVLPGSPDRGADLARRLSLSKDEICPLKLFFQKNLIRTLIFYEDAGVDNQRQLSLCICCTTGFLIYRDG